MGDEVVPIFPRTRGEAWSLQELSESLDFMESLTDRERAEFLADLNAATIEFGWLLD